VIGLDWFWVTFRTLHIVGAVAWAGSVFVFVVFLQPSAAAIGPAAGPMMGQLLGVRRFVDKILVIATVTVVAGGVMYVRHAADAGLGDWLSSGYGLALTIGMVAAVAAYVLGLVVTRPNVQRLMGLQQEIAAGGGSPTPEQGAAIGRIQGTLKVAARTGFGLLVIATVTMATAQNW
jgi:uncharacterized membrane protein